MNPVRWIKQQLDRLILIPLKRRIHFRRYGTELVTPEMAVLSNTREHSTKISSDSKLAGLKRKHSKQALEDLADFLQAGKKLEFPPAEIPTISILLVLYNQASLTLKCLQSILKFAPEPYEVVIVDNASRDQTTELLLKTSNARRFKNEENTGFVNAVNQGVEKSRGQFVLLLNNDATLHPESINSAIETLTSAVNIGAVGGKILLLDGSLQEAGSMVFKDGSCMGYGRHQDPNQPEFQFQRIVDYCSGAFLMFPRKLFIDLGGFDKEFSPAYYEDSDFCVRLKKAGLNTVYDPSAVITHFEFASSEGFENAVELQAKHQKLFVSKHQDYLQGQGSPLNADLLTLRCSNHYKNILFIDDRVPHADLGLGYPRSKEIINTLADAHFNVTFYPLRNPQEHWSDTYQTIAHNAEVMLDHGVMKLKTFLQSRQGFYDIIVVSRIQNLEVLEKLRNEFPELTANTRVFYDAEAVVALREIAQKEAEGQPVSIEIQHSMISKEIAIASNTELITCVSDKEAELFREHGCKKVRVLGHSLEINTTPANFETRKNLLFVGSLREDNSPNVDSLRWFVDEVFPLIIAETPDIRLLVVGDNAAGSLSSLQQDNIQFLGRQSNLEKFYSECRVFIAPTRYAAGIPHKVHEAASFGIPCVTTTLLADQLGWKHGEQLYSAITAKSFAENCLTLYQNKELWLRTRDKALESISNDCSPAKFRDQLLSLFDESQTS